MGTRDLATIASFCVEDEITYVLQQYGPSKSRARRNQDLILEGELGPLGTRTPQAFIAILKEARKNRKRDVKAKLAYKDFVALRDTRYYSFQYPWGNPDDFQLFPLLARQIGREDEAKRKFDEVGTSALLCTPSSTSSQC
jgi:hypothetical protein